MTYLWLLPVTPVVGVAAVLIVMRAFPIRRPSTGQYAFDFDDGSRPRMKRR